MNVMVLNGSPRKRWNTAQLLHAAEDGARSAGAETEYVDLFDLNYTGCRSCLLCKRKSVERCRCYWKDDLSPLIDRIFAADALILGSPIYLGDVTSQLTGLLERLRFCALSYDDYSNYFHGSIDVAVFLTMNAPLGMYERAYRKPMEEKFGTLRFLNGNAEVHPCCDTLQVNDYSKFSMAGFDEAHKREVHETQFPKDLERAYQVGANLGRP